MRHLVRDVSLVLTLFFDSRQAWPKILGGSFDVWGEVSPKRSLDKTLIGTMLKCSPEEITPLVCDHFCLVLGNAKGGHIIGRPLCIKIQS